MSQKTSLIERGLFACAAFSAVIVFLLTFFMIREGLPVLNWSFISGMTWRPSQNLFGILPTLIGTLAVVSGAVILAVAVGVPCAIYLAEYAPFWLRNVVKSTVEVITGIPSVVIGFFGFLVIVPFIRDNIGGQGGSVLAGWLILAVMILPNVITISEDALRAVPKSYREASLALGMTRWQTIRHVMLPAAASGIRASLILGAGRALGETMAVMMVIGNPEIPWIPRSVLDMTRTLTSTIALEFGYAEWGSAHMSALYAIGVVLFLLVVALNFTATFLIRRRISE